MSDEKRSKSTGEVLRVYVAYWLAFGFLVGSLASTELVGALTFYLSILVSVTFLLVYVSKAQVNASPLRFVFAFLILMALMLLPLKVILDFYFSYVCIIAVWGVGVAFAYTFFFAERMSRSPWRYLMPFVLLFLTMATAIMALPDPSSFVYVNK